MKTEKTTINRVATSSTGFKAADNILHNWGCTASQTQDILKIPNSTYFKYRADPQSASLTDDQLERISYILSMHSALRVVFDNQDNVRDFMSMKNHNPYFEGRTPLEVISSGRFGDLYEVFTRIDALRSGQWE
ncbi:MbcA/ParS/Xre antitoxin family protein [Photobacterium alginatilyticum]|uniref:DUF2384 domain-containing protein n=1 Tax=Photobacterium alginatilyticum TaxID=1775171 RepID=A0ABW9YMX8_9GAMM|nr:MbcA/ParS/Xre antitoxin family protein [Photobacterium alginatilyticum]NBI54558.1 DUF2384 domain-containing protein [Photobacterium alginatilyticum]